MEMESSTIWMRTQIALWLFSQVIYMSGSTVAYKQAALNAIAYLMKVRIHLQVSSRR
jgi:hypothetical protein